MQYIIINAKPASLSRVKRRMKTWNYENACEAPQKVLV